PEPIPPKRSLRLRPWKRGREGEYGGGTEGGDKFLVAHPLLSSLSGKPPLHLVIVGLDPAIRDATASAEGAGGVAIAAGHTSAALAAPLRVPGSSPRATKGEGGDDEMIGWNLWPQPFAYASGVRTSNRSTGAICPDGTVLTPRPKIPR